MASSTTPSADTSLLSLAVPSISAISVPSHTTITPPVVLSMDFTSPLSQLVLPAGLESIYPRLRKAIAAAQSKRGRVRRSMDAAVLRQGRTLANGLAGGHPEKEAEFRSKVTFYRDTCEGMDSTLAAATRNRFVIESQRLWIAGMIRALPPGSTHLESLRYWLKDVERALAGVDNVLGQLRASRAAMLHGFRQDMQYIEPHKKIFQVKAARARHLCDQLEKVISAQTRYKRNLSKS